MLQTRGKINSHNKTGTVFDRNQWWRPRFITFLLFPVELVGLKCAAFTVVSIWSVASFFWPAKNSHKLLPI